jgi:hypothetical protein
VTADLDLARHALIVLGDLPSGWTSGGKVTAGSGSGDNVPISKIASCLGVDKAEIKSNVPTENSPLFSRQSDGSTIGDEVETFPSAGAARTDYSTFSNPKTPGCISSIFGPLLREDAQKGGGPGTTVGAIATTREPFPAVGDQSGEIQIVAPFTTSGVSTTLYVDLVDIIVGRLETTLSLTSVGSAFDQTLAGQVAAAAVGHMS